MEYEKYEVIGEEKLSDIAKKYNILPEKIKEANPNARFFKTFFGTSEIVECLQTLKIPIERKIEKKQLELKENQLILSTIKYKYFLLKLGI